MPRQDFSVDSEPADHVVANHLTRMAHGLHRMQGDTIGPFDHPSGVDVDSPFDLEHSLGEVPARLIVEDPGTTGGGVYATESDRDGWTKSSVRIRSKDTLNKMITIRVVGQGGNS